MQLGYASPKPSVSSQLPSIAREWLSKWSEAKDRRIVSSCCLLDSLTNCALTGYASDQRNGYFPAIFLVITSPRRVSKKPAMLLAAARVYQNQSPRTAFGMHSPFIYSSQAPMYAQFSYCLGTVA